MINTKPGVVFKVFTVEILQLLLIVDEIWKSTTGRTPTVTSANDSTHMTGSKHYINMAIDLRSQDLSVQQKDIVFKALQDRLHPMGYDVILESRGKQNEHFHIEHDND
jgi:hypothetical protein